MCTGCELLKEQVVQNTTTIPMMIGYVTSGAMLVFGYLSVFSKRFFGLLHKNVSRVRRRKK